MKKLQTGDEVIFQITGNMGNYKGVVTTEQGHRGYPEVRVTHLEVNEQWVHIERTRPVADPEGR